eukprot:TRINITY_DN3443_c0_g1_i5.p1 TRINITY_DN3443_c0_g1~~TRINITY_DN3443_c0_g1_i5.p1  ORF type:complete len:273 (+),score=89.35 TRINITY_DN3443_c0_g1_i5:278-1096(+)
MFKTPYGPGQISLFNVLHAYSIYDSVLGYTQGMADFAGLFLMHMPEEDAFWMLVQLMGDDKYKMQGLLLEGFPFLHKVCYMQGLILKRKTPRFYTYMQSKNIDLGQLHPYAMEWYMLLFIRVLPYELTLRILDAVLYKGFWYCFNVALGIIKMHEQKLVEIKDECAVLQELKHPEPLFADITPDYFMQFVHRYCKVSRNKVDRYSKRYDDLQKLEKIQEQAEQLAQVQRTKSERHLPASGHSATASPVPSPTASSATSPTPSGTPAPSSPAH